MKGAMRRQVGSGSVYRPKKKLPDGRVVELSRYWIKYHKEGRPMREAAKTSNRKEAERLLKVRLGEIAAGTFRGLRIERIKIDELLDAVLRDYRVNGKAIHFAENAVDNHLRPYFGGRRAVRIETDDVNTYVEFRRGDNQGNRPYRGRLKSRKMIPIRPARNATINRELSLLKRAFYLGWRSKPRKVTEVPYIPMLLENNVRKGFFEHDEFLALRRALPEDLRPILTLAYCTGCRRGEILRLLWSQVDLVERIVRLEPGETKNDEPRILPLTNELLEILSMQQSIRDARYPSCPWVFFREGGVPVRNFYRAWKTACEQAGLTDDSGEANRLFHENQLSSR